MKKRQVFPILYITLVMLLLYLPVMVVVVYSFNGNLSRTAAAQFDGFSLHWYRELFNPINGYGKSFATSLRLALMSVGLSAVLGTLGAVGMLRRKLKSKGLTALSALGEQVTMLPIMIPEIILGIAMLALFSAMGLPFGMLTLVLAHVSFCVPYIYITVKSRLSTLDPALVEAARDLGASPRRAFFTVTLPLIAPAILSGSLLAFAMSMDDFVISFFVNGPQTTTLPLQIYSSVKVGVPLHVNALCTVMLLGVFALVALGQLVSTGRRRTHA